MRKKYSERFNDDIGWFHNGDQLAEFKKIVRNFMTKNIEKGTLSRADARWIPSVEFRQARHVLIASLIIVDQRDPHSSEMTAKVMETGLHFQHWFITPMHITV